MDKKWTQSLTIIGGLGTMLTQSLIGFDVLGADAADPANAIVSNVVELIRNVFALVTVIGARRAIGNSGPTS